MRGLRAVGLAMGLMLAAPMTVTAATAAPMTFPDAIDLLNRERLLAVACARVVKRHLPEGDPAAYSRAELAYEGARADVNGVIARLRTALVEGTEDDELETLAERARAGREKREAFCATAEAMLALPDSSEKGAIAEVVAGSLGEVLDAVTWFVDRWDEQDRVRVQHLTSALEGEMWPAFAAIAVAE